jgi:anionic cell wall polymer biosynthesis LytR-Cps2A-Psr (LCP) family protein
MLYSRPLPADRCVGVMTAQTPRSHPTLAAALSFLLPGLGQAYVTRYRAALLFALPVLLLAAVATAALLLFGDRLRNELLSHRFLIGLLIVNLALLVWRVTAICHAWLARPRPSPIVSEGGYLPAVRDERRRPITVAGVAALLLLTIGMHAYAAVVIDRLNETLEQIFSGGVADASPGNGPSRAADDGAPLNVPSYRWDGTERINFLLLGVDSAPGRREALTDTILVISVDPVSREAVMISVPRDTGFLPLPTAQVYANGLYPHKINELAMEADADPELWCPDLPGEAPCGVRALERTIGLYLGITIHHYARLDLVGYTELIDSVGGVELCLDGNLVDRDYVPIGGGSRGIELPAGCHRYDGRDALAYSRIRMGYLELPDGTRQPQTDFLRNERQQEVLLALRRELARADLVFELPGLLRAIGRTVTTDFPRDRAGDLASLLPLITGEDIEREVLGLPVYVDPPVDPEVNYLLIPRRDAIRDRMSELFGPELEGWYLGSDEPMPPADGELAATGRPTARIMAA